MKRILIAALLAALPAAAGADYVELSRSATLKTAARSDSDDVVQLTAGTRLDLLESEQQAGYYHVQDPVTGKTGWVYHSMGRRYHGAATPVPKVTTQTGAFQFRLGQGCTLPFVDIAPKTDAMASCDNRGQSATTHPALAKQLQAQGKNNFCADASHPVALDYPDFDALQDSVSGENAPDLSTSRSEVQQGIKLHQRQVGEGTVVQLVAHMANAHISDCTSTTIGEAVNCKVLGTAQNDIHIVLMPLDNPTGNECESVTAEMTPHFRPDAWATLDLKTPTKNQVRVTGQLFYDDAHSPCTKDASGNWQKASPARRAVWEIHPVYQLEVCRSSAGCSANDSSQWVAYDKWIAQTGAQTESTGQSQRTSCEAAVKKHGS